MLKRIATVLVLGLTLMANTCQEAQTPAEKLAGAIELSCSFVPTPGTISSLVSNFNLEAGATAALIEQIAGMVCSTVTAQAGPDKWVIKAPDGSPIRIEGEFKK